MKPNTIKKDRCRMALLVGAGLSQAAGLSGTSEITKLILEDNDFMQPNNSNYFWLPSKPHILNNWNEWKQMKRVRFFQQNVRDNPLKWGQLEEFIVEK